MYHVLHVYTGRQCDVHVHVLVCDADTTYMYILHHIFYIMPTVNTSSYNALVWSLTLYRLHWDIMGPHPVYIAFKIRSLSLQSGILHVKSKSFIEIKWTHTSLPKPYIPTHNGVLADMSVAFFMTHSLVGSSPPAVSGGHPVVEPWRPPWLGGDNVSCCREEETAS